MNWVPGQHGVPVVAGGANVAVVPGGVLAAVDADARLGVALLRAAVALALFGLSHQVQQDLARDEVLAVPSVETSPWGAIQKNKLQFEFLLKIP